MRYRNVCLESIAYSLPDEIVTSEEIEARLAPVYRRLRLPEGRLELMTGIRQRRFWPRGTLPSSISAQTAEKAILAAGLDKNMIGALIHGSVCRDYLEPATAANVHRLLELPTVCLVQDVSNACLGLLNGIVQVANMIELGQIRAGVVVGTESSRTLVENTIQRLNEDTSLSRKAVKLAVASLTIGSGSAAVVLVDRQLSRTGNHLLGAIAHAKTDYCGLCHSERDVSIGGDVLPLMWTDSESLLREGVQTAREAFVRLADCVGWEADDIDKTFCHQVGRAHHKLLFESLGMTQSGDFTTYEFLGNTGSVALPITAAMGIERGHLEQGDRLGLFGIGSGINVIMMAVDWQQSPLDVTPVPSQTSEITTGLGDEVVPQP